MTRIAFYSHDTYGMGHLRRCLKIAGAFVRDLGPLDGLIVTGSPWAKRFDRPAGFRFVSLPPVVKAGRGMYRPRDPADSLGSVMRERRRVITDSLVSFRPDLLVVDNVPSGLAGEMGDVLDRLGRSAATRVVLALRDVLDDEDRIVREWRDSESFATVEQYYDEVWVFGAEDCPVAHFLTSRLTVPIVLCGCLGTCEPVPPRRDALAEAWAYPIERPKILVSGGGGGDAEPLIRTYLDAVGTIRPNAIHRIVSGPDYPDAAGLTRQDLSALGVQLVAFDPHLTAAMNEADVVVSMAGYNTVCEALALGKRLVLVPRVWPRREQWLRARRLADRGRAVVLDPRTLTPETLWRAVESALAGKAPAPSATRGELRSSQRARQLLHAGAVV